MLLVKIQVTYRSEGPNVKWDYLQKLHPAIPVIREVASHMEKEFGTLARGNKHTSPKKEEDVRHLQVSFKESTFHEYDSNRDPNTISKGDRVTDFLEKGTLNLQTGATLKNWVETRSMQRAKGQDWPITSEGNTSGPMNVDVPDIT